MGCNGTTCGNFMTTHADVLLAVGVRFADKAASSYKPGASFSIPPTKLIHADIDPFEIGKNYPVEVGIVGDAQAILAGLLEAVRALTPPRDWRDAPYTREIAEQVAGWWAQSRALREADSAPVTMGRAIGEVRKVLPPEGIVFTSSGNVQAQVFQEMPSPARAPISRRAASARWAGLSRRRWAPSWPRRIPPSWRWSATATS